MIARVHFTPTYTYENPFYCTIPRIAPHLYPSRKTYYTLASITVSPLSPLVTTGLRILPRYFALALVRVFKNVKKATVVAAEHV